LLTGSPHATAADGVTWVQELCLELAVPSLGSYGLTESDFATLIAQAERASSMQGNPVKLEESELREILRRAS
jgi:alcohol dehydrogenase class IV